MRHKPRMIRVGWSRRHPWIKKTGFLQAEENTRALRRIGRERRFCRLLEGSVQCNRPDVRIAITTRPQEIPPSRGSARPGPCREGPPLPNPPDGHSSGLCEGICRIKMINASIRTMGDVVRFRSIPRRCHVMCSPSAGLSSVLFSSRSPDPKSRRLSGPAEMDDHQNAADQGKKDAMENIEPEQGRRSDLSADPTGRADVVVHLHAELGAERPS